MRPKIERPCLVTIGRYFDEQLFILKRDDPESFEKGKQLKRLMVGGYLSLIHMNGAIAYSRWAGNMMLAMAKCGGLVLKMNLMRHAFDLIYSLYAGYVPCGLTFEDRQRLQRYKLKYGTDKTTYKDAYDIATDFSNIWGGANFTYNDWKTKLKEPQFIGMIRGLNLTKIDLNERPHNAALHFVDSPILIETRDYIVPYLWKAARTNYYRLKFYNLDSWDFEVVFQNESAPFPDAVMFDLLSRYEQFCGWLPVGDVGLFSPENMSKKNLLDCIGEVQSYSECTGAARSPWQLACLQKRREHYCEENPTYTPYPRMAGEGKVDLRDEPTGFNPVTELKKLGNFDKYPPEAVQYIADELHTHRVLETSIFTDIDKEYIGEPLFNGFDLEPDMLKDVEETELFGLHDFAALIANEFNIKDGMIDGKFQRPKKSLFADELKRMQQLKEFRFFKKIFQSGTGDFSGGLFIQACIDYSNRFDPNFRDPNEDGWMEWHVIDMGGNEGALVNDRKYFLPGTTVEDDGTQKSGINPWACKVKAEGLVCYGYDEYGEALLASALYTEGASGCSLSSLSYDRVKGAIQKNPNTGMVRLPVMTESEIDGSLLWRGAPLHGTDLNYWHCQLGHISLRGIKKYMRTVKGMPPYFWPFKVSCEECYGNGVQRRPDE